MKSVLSMCAIALLAAACAAPPGSRDSGWGGSSGDQPNILVLGEDADADTVPRGNRAFKRVLDALTPQRIMWGSNFPSSREGGYGAQVELAKTALPFLSDDDRRWILGDTALTLWPRLKGPAN